LHFVCEPMLWYWRGDRNPTLPTAIKTGTEGRVYSFEPDTECGQALEYNIDL